MTSSEIADAAKNAGLALAALSGVVYTFGYLVIRARCRALGTDPGFTLIDQAYVFAGFRFVLTLLFAMLLAAPGLLLLYWIGHLAGSLAPIPLLIVKTVVAFGAGIATIGAFVATIQVNGVLLEPSPGWLAQAALGRNNYGALILVATTTVGTAIVFWANEHLARVEGLDPLGAALSLIGVLLMVLLPMQHGVFHADRNMRQLERAPCGVTGLEPPIWLVDRGSSDRVVLFGRNADGQARLVMVKAEKLDGIAVTGISSLGTAVEERNP